MNVSIEQARKRFRGLMPSLQDAMFSVQTAEIIRKVCEQNNIPEEKIPFVAEAAGLVFLGFIHIEDLSTEIKDGAGIAPQVASAIASDLAAKIFTPLKDDLDKIYAPALHEHEQENVAAPKLIQDIGPAPQIVSRVAATPPPVTPPPHTPPPMAMPPPAAPKPKLPDVGWSRMTPEEPVVKLSQTSTPPPAAPPAAPHTSQPATAKPAPLSAQGSMGEFERIAMQSKEAPAPAVPPAPKPAVPSEPAPVMLHQDASFKPTERAPEFHLQLPSDKFAGEKGSSQPPVRPAVLELGKTPMPTAPRPASTPRVVHYTEYKSPSPEAPVPPAQGVQGPRRVTEIISSASATQSVPPKPPSPPSPPAPPIAAAPRPSVPPPPQTPPKNKVTYKDYSAAAPSLPPTPPKVKEN